VNLTFFLHPTDREWLVSGIATLFVCGLTLSSQFWRHWSYPRKKANLLAENPSFTNEIEDLFSEYQTRAFSKLSRLVCATWVINGLIMIALAYLKSTKYGFKIFCAMLFVYCAAMILTGLHVSINARLYDIVSMIDYFRCEGFDIRRIKGAKWKPVTNFLIVAFFMAPALYFLSCLVFKYPYELHPLLIRIHELV